MIKQKQKNSSFRNMDIYLSQRVCDSWNAKELSSLNCLYNINGIRGQHMKNKNNTKKGEKITKQTNKQNGEKNIKANVDSLLTSE